MKKPRTKKTTPTDTATPETEAIDLWRQTAPVRSRGARKAANVTPTTGSVTRYDPLEAFLREIQRYPLLTPDEEKELADRYAQDGDLEAAARLVTANLRLVVKIAFEYRRAYRNIMDLIQEGNIGLMQAVKKFDPTRGVKLSSYAAWWIRAYILRFVLNNWRLVKIGTTQAQRKLFFNLNKERLRLTAQGVEPTPEALAARLSVTADEVVEMERRLQGADVSLDAESSDNEGRTTSRLNMLTDGATSQDERVHTARFDDAVHEHLEQFATTLADKEQYIFRNRLMVDEPMTLQDIGASFGVSRERVRQIEKRLLNRLRVHLETSLPGYFEGVEPGP